MATTRTSETAITALGSGGCRPPARRRSPRRTGPRPPASASRIVMVARALDGGLLGQLGEQTAQQFPAGRCSMPRCRGSRRSRAAWSPAPDPRSGSSTVAWTVTSWKSAVRAWNSSACSRSSRGTWLRAAVRGRNQNAAPAPSWATPPFRRWRTYMFGSDRRCLATGIRGLRVMSAMACLASHSSSRTDNKTTARRGNSQCDK